MAQALRWIVNELRRNFSITALFVLNVAIGLTGFMLVDSYKNSITAFIEDNRKALLSADVAVSARRDFTEAEMKAIDAAMGPAPRAVSYEFFAMATIKGQSRLVTVKTVDANYPLYGKLELARGGTAPIGPQGLWLSKEAADAFQAGVGDEVSLGELKLPATDLVVTDSTQTLRSFGLSPRVYLSEALLASSKLIQFGSTYSKALFFKVPDDAVAAQARKNLLTQIPDPGVRIDTAESSAQDSNRQLGYLSDFLSLAAIVSLILAAIGSSYILRLYIQRKIKNIAILRSLGLRAHQVLAIYVTITMILGGLAVVPALVATQALIPLFNILIGRFSAMTLSPVVSFSSVLAASALTLVFSVLVALPILIKIKDHKPSLLFSESKFDPEVRFGRFWTFLPAVALIWLMAIVQAKSLKIASIFFASTVGAFFAIGAFGALILWLGGHAPLRTWYLRQSLRSLTKRWSSTLAVFIAIGLGTLLMTLLPQIKATLNTQVDTGANSKVPSLFLFDIQDEQLAPVKAFAQERSLNLMSVSPMVRARILSVNGQKYERRVEEGEFLTREEERKIRFRNRGVNLSYREELSDSEKLIEGQPLPTSFDPAGGWRAKISVEYKYAQDMDMHLGDVVVFDVQGLEIEAEIANFRQIEWTSFRPNFFISFQPGVLEEAPKTWIAGISQLTPQQTLDVQSQLTQAFPNISSINVRKAVEDVLKIADQMSSALQLISALAIFTGFIVLLTITRTQAQQRRNELNLLKVLGAKPSHLVRYLTFEFGLISVLAALLGGLLSLFGGFIFAKFVFDQLPKYDLASVFGIVIAVSLTGVILAALTSWNVTRQDPADLLREG